MIHEPRVDKVRSLRFKWQSDALLTQAIEGALDRIGFTEEYIASVGRSGLGHRKAIKDSVWGMLEFDREEMAVIDSPLLQRLRSIRQLGFSYLTYPTAEHSRFAHSLGMAHVVGRFIANINRRREGDPPALSPTVKGFQDFTALAPLKERELRYAALLHDVGHLPFSHAGESAVKSREELFRCGGGSVRDRITIAAAQTHLGKSNSISELISLMLILSKRFEAFYAVIDPANAKDPDSLLRIACLIAGVPAIAACPNIQDIISAAALDADKVDYVGRDAQACGISVGVDVSRIFLGGGIVLAQARSFDPTYSAEEWRSLFVVNASGADTLDEIVQARSSLYHRVYLHPVTRTAEALLTAALHHNARRAEGSAEPTLTDVFGLWATDDQQLIQTLCRSSDEKLAKLGDMLRLRRLPKKACAIAAKLTELQVPLNDVFKSVEASQAQKLQKDVANSFLERLTREQIQTVDVPNLEARITGEALRLRDKLASIGRTDLIPGEPLEIVTFTPIAAMDAVRTDAMVFQGGELIRTPIVTNVQGQQDALDIFKAVGFVACDEPWREIVLHASRRIIYDLSRSSKPQTFSRFLVANSPTSEVRFQHQTILELQGLARRANIPASRAETYVSAAEEAGYFDDAPLLARRTEKTDPKVRDVARRFRIFDGDWGWRVSKESVAAFVDQFPHALRKDALEMLRGGTVLDREELVKLVSNAVERLRAGGSGERMVMVPLSPSSGGSVHADVRDQMQGDVDHASSLAEVLVEGDQRTIVLLDDNAASGVQAAAQLYTLAGVGGDQKPLELSKEEEFVSTLDTPHLNLLRGRKLALCVAMGTERAAARIAEAANAVGFNFEGLFYGQEIAPAADRPQALEMFLRGVGRELISLRTYGKPYRDLVDEDMKRFCEERSFGYGELGGVLTTRANVPTSTITALWQPGLYQDRPWVPLFLRRGRFSELILG